MNEQADEKFDYYKYAYPSYIISGSVETKSNIVNGVFKSINDIFTFTLGRMGLSDEKKEIKEIESSLQRYYRCSNLGEDLEEEYENIKNKLLPGVITKIYEAIDKQLLDKEMWSKLLTHFFIIIRDYMNKVEENIKEKRV